MYQEEFNLFATQPHFKQHTGCRVQGPVLASKQGGAGGTSRPPAHLACPNAAALRRGAWASMRGRARKYIWFDGCHAPPWHSSRGQVRRPAQLPWPPGANCAPALGSQKYKARGVGARVLRQRVPDPLPGRRCPWRPNSPYLRQPPCLQCMRFVSCHAARQSRAGAKREEGTAWRCRTPRKQMRMRAPRYGWPATSPQRPR